jgi:hypothetical protein
LRAAINRKSLPAKLFYDYSDYYTLLLSSELRAEIDDVLHRPSVRTKFSQLTDEVVTAFLAQIDDAESSN